jgi:hypothetical protein
VADAIHRGSLARPATQAGFFSHFIAVGFDESTDAAVKSNMVVFVYFVLKGFCRGPVLRDCHARRCRVGPLVVDGAVLAHAAGAHEANIVRLKRAVTSVRKQNRLRRASSLVLETPLSWATAPRHRRRLF